MCCSSIIDHTLWISVDPTTVMLLITGEKTPVQILTLFEVLFNILVTRDKNIIIVRNDHWLRDEKNEKKNSIVLCRQYLLLSNHQPTQISVFYSFLSHFFSRSRSVNNNDCFSFVCLISGTSLISLQSASGSLNQVHLSPVFKICVIISSVKLPV